MQIPVEYAINYFSFTLEFETDATYLGELLTIAVSIANKPPNPPPNGLIDAP